MSGTQGQADLAQLASVLAEAIPADKGREFPFRIIRYLAQRAMDAGSGAEPVRVATKEIHLDVEGNPRQEASAWMSGHWKTIQNATLPSIEHALIEKSRSLGLEQYPWVEKLPGNPAYYYLAARPLPPSSEVRSDHARRDLEPVPGGVRYAADLTLRPSLLGRLFMGNGYAFTWRKRLLLVTFNAIAYVVLLGLSAISLYVLHSDRDPLSAHVLIELGMALLLIPMAIHQMLFGTRLMEDRIVLASDFVIGIREQGATMEVGPGSKADDLQLHLRRYTATCTVCQSLVKLDDGKPDFPRRLVGRCTESPREHVFSFDRVTLLGKPLVTPC